MHSWSDMQILTISRSLVKLLCSILLDEPSKSCAVGFLTKESLNQIVNATNDTSQKILSSLTFTQNNITQCIQLNESGNMIKISIAAKFNHSEHSGWPILQIRRGRLTNNMAIIIASLKPRPTGYLNVFEYETYSVDIQPGDELCIFNFQSVMPTKRYLLAYLNHSSNSVLKPMVYANVSVDNEVVSTPTTITAYSTPNSYSAATTTSIPVPTTVHVYSANSSTTYCPKTSTITNLVSSTASATTSFTATSGYFTTNYTTSSDFTATISHSSSKRQPVIGIIGGVFGTLVILILLALLIIIIVFLTYRHKQSSKHFPPNTDVRTMPANNRFNALDNATYAPDSILPASDQMMSSDRRSEGGVTVATGRGAGAASSSQNNPQEVSSSIYIYVYS